MDEDDEITVELRRRRKAAESVHTERLEATPRTQRLPQSGPEHPQPQQGTAPSVYQTPYGQYGPPPPAYPVQRYTPQPAIPPPAYNSIVTSGRAPAPGVVIAIAWILAMVSFFYLLPWAVAATRNKSNQGAIFLVNFFLGWSLIGWIVALVMACTAEPQTNVVIVNYAPQYYR